MVFCSKCESGNSLDSVFCKKCGNALPADRLEAAAVELEDQLRDGYACLHAGKAAAALSIAENVLLCNPSLASAWSLKGLALEQEGQLGGALDACKRAAALNEDSALDKLKVEQLSAKFVSMPSAHVPNRRFAAVGAAATVVLVVVAGALLGTMTAKASAPEKKAPADLSHSSPLEEPVLVRSAPKTPQRVEPKVLDKAKRPPTWSDEGWKPWEFEGPIELKGQEKSDRKKSDRDKIKTTPPPPPPPPIGGLAEQKDKGTYEITVVNGGQKGGPGA